MGQDYDVIVVGGGPGGSSAAGGCARSGLRTLIIEKERFPRYKPCGGCLSLKSIQLLDFDFGSVIENTIYGVKFTYGFREPFFFQSRQPIAFLVMRDRFDDLLARKALEAGAEFLEGETVRGIRERGSGIEVELARGETLRSEYLIGADGPLSVVARSLSLLSPSGHRDGIGLASEVPFESIGHFPEEASRFIHLDFGGVPNGYGWVFPKKEVLSIGIGGLDLRKKAARLRPVFASFLKDLEYLDGRGNESARAHPLPSFYHERQKVARGKVLLVGDAAHLLDPLMGEGIYYALRSGRLAAEAIVRSKAEGTSASDLYQESVQAQIFNHLKWALYFSRFAFRFTRLAFRTLKRYSDLGDHYLRVMEGKENYQTFVSSVKERMKELLGGRLSEKIKRAMARS
jgi:geranylgeranyl reductase family protein